jgi:hypothetical protein
MEAVHGFGGWVSPTGIGSCELPSVANLSKEWGAHKESM